jgi:transposase
MKARWHPDPLLLELFDSVEKELACALEEGQRLSGRAADPEVSRLIAIHLQKIARLRIALEALEKALDARHSAFVH